MPSDAATPKAAPPDTSIIPLSRMKKSPKWTSFPLTNSNRFGSISKNVCMPRATLDIWDGDSSW